MLEPKILKSTARQKLPDNHKLLALIHTAAALGVNLVIVLLQMFLNRQIGDTGGLSGLGARSALETAQMVLSYGVNIAMPFWTLGFAYSALGMARGMRPDNRDLLEGFRRFGPALRMLLLRGLMYMGAMMAGLYAGAFIFSMTPLANPLMETVMPLLTEGGSIEEAQAVLLGMPFEELASLLLPFFIIGGILALALGMMLFYRFRVADFILMDQPGTGALAALLGSSRLTKGYRWKLVRLDLSFWWFYVLAGISMVVMNGDLLLSRLHVELAGSEEASWLIAYVLGLVVELIVYWQFYSHMQATIATAYDALRQRPPEVPKPIRPAPQRLPWDPYPGADQPEQKEDQ